MAPSARNLGIDHETAQTRKRGPRGVRDRTGRGLLTANVRGLDDLELTPSELELLSSVFKPGARAGERYTPGYFSTLGA
ncbi:MAG: hypothetical protein A3H33_14845 [Betaproteobacteria bacterium RIFCSPLOWO2_02_FULL_65_20]|nr:MAG: hypothetical protein A3H33_14845 [Betaproteobacteria bacterium RIFCSPLOWO2_02_FULL_65_20]